MMTRLFGRTVDQAIFRDYDQFELYEMEYEYRMTCPICSEYGDGCMCNEPHFECQIDESAGMREMLDPNWTPSAGYSHAERLMHE